MSKSENHPPVKTGVMDYLLKVLDCLGKLFQIAQTGYTLMKNLGLVRL